MLVVILLGVLSLLVVYLRLNYRYWTKRGVVQEPPLPVVGNLLDVILKRRSGGQVFDAIYQKFCKTHDAVGVYDFMTPNLLLLNPSLIKQVLTSYFSSFHDNEFYVTRELDPYLYNDPFCLRGEAWKTMRHSFASLMTSSKVKDMFPYMKELLPQLDNYLDQHKSKDLEAKDLASLFMMNIVSNSVFGVQCNCFIDPDSDFRKMGELVIPQKVSDYLETMMQQVVEYRKKNNIKRNDAIDNIMNKSGDDVFEMVSLGVTIFVDGFETSSTVGAFILYELAMNPEVQERLHEEIKTATCDSSDVSFETLHNLQYLDKVFKETMRKYALIYMLKKICTKRCSLEIDGRSVEIEPNTPIIIPFYRVHNDPRYYPDPEKFDPERFSDDNAEHADTYYPFGVGPRICPGKRFGQAQVKLLIWNLVLKFKILPTKATPKKLTFSKNSLMLVSEKPLILKFERRKL